MIIIVKFIYTYRFVNEYSCFIDFVKGVWEKDKCEVWPSILSFFFRNEFNNFNNAGE